MSFPSDRLLALGEVMERAADVAHASREQMGFELKPDGSIVTNSDRAVETFLRKELADLIPGTSFWGEEFGRDEPSDKGHWLIDPIDGTSNFAYGSPLWGISVALAVGNRIEMGAIWLPELEESYLAEFGMGAWCNDQLIPAIPPGEVLRHQLVSYSDWVTRLYPDQRFVGKMRCSGAFVIDGCFTALQRYRGLIGRGEQLYDVAASILINQEIGADIRWANGEAIDYAQMIAGRSFDRAWIIFPADSGFLLTEPT